ncbi:MAG: VIT domain-containing protein [Acidobacteriota bacterium]
MPQEARFRIAVISFVTLALAGAVPAAPATSAPSVEPPPATGRPSVFLLRRTDVRAVVTGPIAHVEVTQKWENPNTETVDGLYIFPLPESAAVTDMTLRIGERVIRSEMLRREEAREIYERAREEGRVAGLLDQERPNVFAQRVANILPGAGIEVILAFDQEIRCEDGACEYVFPTVVGPRFVPPDQGDPGLVDPPVVAPGQGTGQRLDLALHLDAGVPLHDLRSPSHQVSIEREGATRARIVLAAHRAAALDRDFRMRWRVGGEAPEVGLLSWRDPEAEEDKGVFTLILQPPAPDAVPAPDDLAVPRELVFVIDCSGSMRGVPIAAAREVVKQALQALRPRDTFRIVRFSERASGLGPRPLAPTPENVRRAVAYLDSLQGQGGTHMISGIRAALEGPADPERLRIVAFLTDGFIGNEQEILAEVRRLLGASRLFSFGIGSSVNRYLLEGLAEEGRGASAFLGPRETPEEMVARFVKRIETPIFTDIRISWEDLEVEDLEPASVPDLFAGQPLVIHGRYRRPGTGLVLVEGRRGGVTRTLRRVVILRELATDNEALGRLWARARIHRLSRELAGEGREDVKESIVGLALGHRLMTPWTSLVAVDSLVSNTGGTSRPVVVPVEMPQDVSYEGVFGHGVVARSLGYATAPRSSRSVSRALALSQPFLVEPSPAPRLDERAGDVAAKSERDTVEFTRLTLVMSDRKRIVVESDGELWVIDGRRRRLARALTASQMDSVQRALRAADPESWSGVRSGARLVLEVSGRGRIVRLPSTSGAVERLADLLRELAL